MAPLGCCLHLHDIFAMAQVGPVWEKKKYSSDVINCCRVQCVHRRARLPVWVEEQNHGHLDTEEFVKQIE